MLRSLLVLRSAGSSSVFHHAAHLMCQPSRLPSCPPACPHACWPASLLLCVPAAPPAVEATRPEEVADLAEQEKQETDRNMEEMWRVLTNHGGRCGVLLVSF